MELKRIAGQLPVDRMCESDSGENWEEQDEDGSPSPTITCRVAIHQVYLTKFFFFNPNT